MSKNRDLTRESRSFGYEKHERTKKSTFFLNLELPQSQILRFGPRCGWSDISSQFFLRLSGRESICLCFLRCILEKTGRIKKKFMKKSGFKRILWPIFGKKKSEKKSNFFKKNFFKSCSFDAKTSAKKNFFLKKIPPKISAQIWS